MSGSPRRGTRRMIRVCCSQSQRKRWLWAVKRIGNRGVFHSTVSAATSRGANSRAVFSVLSIALLLPYFAWGLYTLHRRFRYHEDFSLALEAVTLGVLILFFAVELFTLRMWMMRESPLAYLFSVLGLFGSGAALYGHMVISFGSRLMVDMMVPGPAATHDRPRLGAAEGLERVRDWEGAYNEYLVLARMYPKDHEVPLRAAEALVELGRKEEATEWFARALKRCPDATRALHALNRLVEMLRSEARHEEARAELRAFLKAHPDGEVAETVRNRLERLDDRPAVRPVQLAALAEDPMESATEDTAPAMPVLLASDEGVPEVKAQIALQDLDSLEVADEGFEPEVKDRPSSLGIDSLDEQPVEDDEDDTPRRPTRLSEQGLEAMDEGASEKRDDN